MLSRVRAGRVILAALLLTASGCITTPYQTNGPGQTSLAAFPDQTPWPTQWGAAAALFHDDGLIVLTHDLLLLRFNRTDGTRSTVSSYHGHFWEIVGAIRVGARLAFGFTVPGPLQTFCAVDEPCDQPPAYKHYWLTYDGFSGGSQLRTLDPAIPLDSILAADGERAYYFARRDPGTIWVADLEGPATPRGPHGPQPDARIVLWDGKRFLFFGGKTLETQGRIRQFDPEGSFQDLTGTFFPRWFFDQNRAVWVHDRALFVARTPAGEARLVEYRAHEDRLVVLNTTLPPWAKDAVLVADGPRLYLVPGIGSDGTTGPVIQRIDIPDQIVENQAPEIHLWYQMQGRRLAADISNSTDDLGGVWNPFWDFGDGSAPKYGYQVEHEFSAPGNYTVRIKAVDEMGVSAAKTISVAVT